MTITTGAFDAAGVPQGSRNNLDDLTDVDVSEAKQGNTIAKLGERWVAVSGNEVAITDAEPADTGVELWVNYTEGTDLPPMTTEDADLRYVNISGDTMTGRLTLPQLSVTGPGPEPGKVWTAEDTLGSGAWQDPSSLVVAETSDPVLINWYDNSTEGWVRYSGAGTMSYTEMNSPSMPGVLSCNGDVWCEWTFGEPMVYEPGALYRMTVRARMDAAGILSFGFQGYDSASPANPVGSANTTVTNNPHWCAVGLTPGDDMWVDDVNKPGKWLSWTGFLSGKSNSTAENMPNYAEWTARAYYVGEKVHYTPLKQNFKCLVDDNTGSPEANPAGWLAIGFTSPGDEAVQMASGVRQWRPMFRASAGKVWIDAIEVHRLDRSLELPGGITVASVNTDAVNATTVITEHLVLRPSITGNLLTATDDAGNSDWLPMPVTVNEGPPQRTNLLTENQESVETDLTGITGLVTPTRVVGDTPYGNAFLRTGNTNPAYSHTYVQMTGPVSGRFPVTAGFYSASVTARFTKATAGTTWGLYIVRYDAAGTYISEAYMGAIHTDLPSDWTRITGTYDVPGDTASISLRVHFNGVVTGDLSVDLDAFGLWEGPVPYPEGPSNPETIMLGTLYGKHGGGITNLGTTVTITNTTAARVAGSYAMQWTQTVPAFVTIRQNCYVGQSGNATANIYVNIGVEDANTGAMLLTDTFGGPVIGTTLYGGSLFRSNTGGITYVPMSAIWRRQLPPGTYMSYPVAWVNAVDAANKTISYGYQDFEIDPNMTYLPGMRA